MPNWCQNTASFYNSDKSQLNRIVESIKTESLFNEFVPLIEDDDIDVAKIKWGTKWDVYNPYELLVTEEKIVVSFDTAWSPPIQFYREMTAQGFIVDAMYYEDGIGYCGEYTSAEDDVEYSILGDSSWVEENIPKHINEEFNIAGNMAEWEQENEDE